MRHPQSITTREQFDATEFEVGVVYEDGDPDALTARWVKTLTGWDRTYSGQTEASFAITDAGSPLAHLPMTLVSEPEPTPVFKVGDLVTVLPGARRCDTFRSEKLASYVGKVVTVAALPDDDGDYRVVGDDGYSYVLPQFLSPVVPESEPTPQSVTPEPAMINGLRIPEPQAPATPEVTDEQRAAVEWLREMDRSIISTHARVLLAALPSDLTDPQPVLPIEPGRYRDNGGDDGWKLLDDGTWHYNDSPPFQLFELFGYAPFTRLVPEREPITRERVIDAIDAGFRSGMPGSVEYADALHAALVNGADQ